MYIRILYNNICASSKQNTMVKSCIDLTLQQELLFYYCKMHWTTKKLNVFNYRLLVYRAISISMHDCAICRVGNLNIQMK